MINPYDQWGRLQFSYLILLLGTGLQTITFDYEGDLHMIYDHTIKNNLWHFYFWIFPSNSEGILTINIFNKIMSIWTPSSIYDDKCNSKLKGPYITQDL